MIWVRAPSVLVSLSPAAGSPRSVSYTARASSVRPTDSSALASPAVMMGICGEAAAKSKKSAGISAASPRVIARHTAKA